MYVCVCHAEYVTEMLVIAYDNCEIAIVAIQAYVFQRCADFCSLVFFLFNRVCWNNIASS